MSDIENVTVPDHLVGADAIAQWVHHHHDSTCPYCGADVLRVGLANLVYIFVSCDCRREPFQHLVEQVWHRECFRQSVPA